MVACPRQCLPQFPVRIGVPRVAVERPFETRAGPLGVVERVETERPAAVPRERVVRGDRDGVVVLLLGPLGVVERPPQQVSEVVERGRVRRVAIERPLVPLAGADGVGKPLAEKKAALVWGARVPGVECGGAGERPGGGRRVVRAEEVRAIRVRSGEHPGPVGRRVGRFVGDDGGQALARRRRVARTKRPDREGVARTRVVGGRVERCRELRGGGLVVASRLETAAVAVARRRVVGRPVDGPGQKPSGARWVRRRPGVGEK